VTKTLVYDNNIMSQKVKFIIVDEYTVMLRSSGLFDGQSPEDQSPLRGATEYFTQQNTKGYGMKMSKMRKLY
jgi:hypothetical protein